MPASRRAVLTAAVAGAAALPFRRARAQANDVIKIGVLTDLSGNYRDVTGPTSVICAQLAVDEFTKANPGIKVELISGDHLNKPDVAAGIAREWYDRDGVDVITDVGNSAAAIAVTTVAQEKDKIHLNTSAGSSVLTGKYCSPNQLHWTYDTWNLSHTMVKAIVGRGGDKWYFITADYTFGHSIQDDATKLLAGVGGKVVGSSAYPFPGTTEFSSYLLEAKASGANVLAFANAGDDLINCVKQSQEFGITGLTLAAMVGSITAVTGAGLDTMQNVVSVREFLLGPERPHPRLYGAREAASAGRRLSERGACRHLFGRRRLSEDRQADGGRAGQGVRPRDGRGDEGAADRRRRVRPRLDPCRWPGDPSRLSVPREDAGPEQISRRLLRDPGDGSRRRRLPPAKRRRLRDGPHLTHHSGQNPLPQCGRGQGEGE